MGKYIAIPINEPGGFNERSIATSSPKETACYALGEIRNEMKVCIIQVCATHPVQDMVERRHLLVLRSTAETGPLTWSHHLDGIGIQIQTNN